MVKETSTLKQKAIAALGLSNEKQLSQMIGGATPESLEAIMRGHATRLYESEEVKIEAERVIRAHINLASLMDDVFGHKHDND